MAGKKYASDYRMEETILPGGKKKSHRVYQGVYYQFSNPPEELRRLRLELLIGSVLIAALLLPLLFANTTLARTIYVALPCVVALAPSYLLFAVGLRLAKPERQLTREDRDKTDQRLRGAGLMLPIFLGISCLGCALHAFLDGIAGGEIPTVICIAAAWVISMYLLTRRKKADCNPVESA